MKKKIVTKCSGKIKDKLQRHEMYVIPEFLSFPIFSVFPIILQ